MNTQKPRSPYCSVCKEPSTIKCGNQALCDKHYRFSQMRSGAKRHGKAVPERSDLESMAGADLVCPDCGVRMNWRARDGERTVASLQHYRDGSFAIVCRTCNTRHAHMEGDSYRTMQKDHKQCPCCKAIKPLSEFHNDKSRGSAFKKKSFCKVCAAKSSGEWKVRNREQYNAYMKTYLAKRRAIVRAAAKIGKALP